MATAIKRAESVHKQGCAAAAPRTDDAAQDLHGQVVDTQTCCLKVPVPDALAVILETLEPWARLCVERMLVPPGTLLHGVLSRAAQRHRQKFDRQVPAKQEM